MYKGYKLLDIETHAVSVSRHVFFHKDIFSLASSNIKDMTKDFFPHFHSPVNPDEVPSRTTSSDVHPHSDASSSEPLVPFESKPHRQKKTPKHLQD